MKATDTMLIILTCRRGLAEGVAAARAEVEVAAVVA